MTIQFPELTELINDAFVPAWESKDRYLLLYGGRGSSKSHFAAMKLIFRCLTEKRFKYLLVRETYHSIKDSQYATIKEIVSDWGLQEFFTFKLSPLEIHCINGNSFHARGCDNTDKIKSVKDPTGAWYEEGNNISKEDFLTITTTIRTQAAEYLQEIFTFNPECEGNYEDFWMHQMFFRPERIKERIGQRGFTADLEIEMPDGDILRTPYMVHHSTYHDNAWITDEFIAFLENLKTLDPYYYEVYTLGNWGAKKITNPFMHQFDEKKHVSLDAVFRPEIPLLINLDFNLNPFAVTFAQMWRDKDGEHFHIVDEAEIENGNIPAMAELIIRKYGKHLHTAKITGDAMGKKGEMSQRDNASLYLQLERLLPGVRNSQFVLPGNPTHENSRADCNFVLAFFPDFKINPTKCPNTLRDFKNVECDAFGTILKKNRKDIDQRADYLDTIRYSINTFLRPWVMNQTRFAKK